jgi:hypothetical protein
MNLTIISHHCAPGEHRTWMSSPPSFRCRTTASTDVPPRLSRIDIAPLRTMPTTYFLPVSQEPRHNQFLIVT